MSDSNEHEDLVDKHEQIREDRIVAVKRWVQYIKEHPPEVWGTQQNKLVNSQLESARATNLDAAHYQRVKQASRDK